MTTTNAARKRRASEPKTIHCLDCGIAFETRKGARCPRCEARHYTVIKKALNDKRYRVKRESVYSPSAVRHIVASIGACRGCGIGVKQLVNGYCDVCRACGANERECMR